MIYLESLKQMCEVFVLRTSKVPVYIIPGIYEVCYVYSYIQRGTMDTEVLLIYTNRAIALDSHDILHKPTNEAFTACSYLLNDAREQL